jgi:hypothetical protein
LKRTFKYSQKFIKQWENTGLNEIGLKDFKESLTKNPNQGDVISGGNGLRKVRYSIPGKGKSGGVRVIYIDFPEQERIYLLLVYKKNVQEDITPDQKKILLHFVSEIRKELVNKGGIK